MSNNQLYNVSEDRSEFYNKTIELYEAKLEKIKPLENNESLKNFRRDCQRVIYKTLNTITASNPQHLSDKFEKLYNFITGEPIIVAEGIFTVKQHPLGPDFSMMFFIKQLIKQAGTEIAGIATNAFSIAAIIVSLWKLIPEFGILLLGNLFKESPYLVPYYVTKEPQQSIEDYLKMLGYEIIDGVIEDQEMFLKRQIGFARLFAAIMITDGRKIDGPFHPFGMKQCWSWLTNFINMQPMPDINTAILYEVLQTLSAHLFDKYGGQFLKLIFFIKQSYIPKVKYISNTGLTIRLELLLDKYLSGQKFQMPPGLLPQGFW